MDLAERTEGAVEIFPDGPAKKSRVVAREGKQRRPLSLGLKTLGQPLRLRPFSGSVDPFDSDQVSHFRSSNAEAPMTKEDEALRSAGRNEIVC